MTATGAELAARLRDALGAIRSDHAAARASGAPATSLAAAELQQVAWVGGLAIGSGLPATPLLDAVDGTPAPDLDAHGVADALARAIPLARQCPADAWPALWPAVAAPLTAFLDALEARARAPGLARRARRALELQAAAAAAAVARAGDPVPAIVGTTAHVRLDVTGPIVDLAVVGTERLVCAVECAGDPLGTLTLPVFDDAVPAAVLADALAARHAWALLGRFLARHVYPTIRCTVAGDGVDVARGDVTLATGAPADVATSPAALHDAVGWVVFLQELLGLPAWSNDRFYDASAPHPDEAIVACRGEARVLVELAGPLPSLSGLAGESAQLVACLGGAPAFAATVAAVDGAIPAATVRARLLEAGGMELVRVAVREALLLGRPWSDATPLRSRLREAAEPRAGDAGGEDASVAGRMARLVGWPDGAALLVGAPPDVSPESPCARRSSLPAAAAELLADTLRPGQPIVRAGHGEPGRAIYLPELTLLGGGGVSAPAGAARLPGAPADGADAADGAGAARASAPTDAAGYGRHHFETLFARTPDPWKYTSPYEQTKYEQTLSLVPSRRVGRALELGCAEGHFTAQLAPRVGTLVAADISEIALRRTAERCAALPNVSYARLDIATDPLPPGAFDLIVCSETLYYVGDRAALAALARRVAAALAPGGSFVAAHMNLVVDDPDATGFDWRMPFGARVIGETFAGVPELEFECELRTPLYRVQRFRRRPPWWIPPRRFRRTTPRTVTHAPAAPPEPDVATHVLWSGGRVAQEDAAPVTTYRLPILMYHRVAPTGPASLRRFRVTPEAFEAQIRYLRDAGFRPATFAEWRHACRERRPLPGRRVLLTFDDGYADFAEHAWPVLRRYGFRATVFLPTDLVGGRAVWDEAVGEPAPLLAWDQVRRLHAEGVSFGAHAATHTDLTTLGPADVVRELARSRSAIERALGTVVDAVAYPYGQFDETVARLAAACGLEHGVTTRPGRSHPGEDPLALSRIEVRGVDDRDRADDLHRLVASLAE